MSVIEDARKIVQDLVAPELQSLHAKIDGLEKTVDAKFGVVDAKLDTMNQRIASLERETSLRLVNAEERSSVRHELLLAHLETFSAKIGARFDAVERKAEQDKSEILNALQTDKRIRTLEEVVFVSPKPRQRQVRIESHLEKHQAGEKSLKT